MKKMGFAIALSTLVFAFVIGLGGAAKAKKAPPPKGIPLASLAGNFAGQGNGTLAICFTSGFAARTACSGAADVAFYIENEVHQGTADKSGNACYTQTFTNSPEFPNPGTPANTFTQISTITVTSYDPATGIGEASFKGYLAGSGTSCNGSVLVNTANASVIASGTQSFVVSQSGDRVDAIVETFAASPVSDVGDVVFSSFSLRQ